MKPLVQVVEIIKANGQSDVQYKEYACGHVPMDEEPDKLLTDLQQFVTEVGCARQRTPHEGLLSAQEVDTALPLYPPSKTAPVQG